MNVYGNNEIYNLSLHQKKLEEELERCEKYRHKKNQDKFKKYFENAINCFNEMSYVLTYDVILSTDNKYSVLLEIRETLKKFFEYAESLGFDWNETKNRFFYKISYYMGRAYLEEENYSMALRYLNDALRYLDKESESYNLVYHYIGNAYAGMDDLNNALNAYNEAITYKEKSPKTWLSKAYTLLNLKRYKEAIIAAKTAIEMNVDDWNSFLFKGIIECGYFILGNYNKVVNSCQNIKEDLAQFKLDNNNLPDRIISLVSARLYVYSLALTKLNVSPAEAEKYMNISKKIYPDLSSNKEIKMIIEDINNHNDGTITETVDFEEDEEIADVWSEPSAKNDSPFPYIEKDNPLELMLRKLNGNPKTTNEVLSELDSLIGLNAVKKEISNLVNVVQNRKKREAAGLKVPELSLHMVFSGNPGTGKTTVARIVAEIFKNLGLISKGQLVEVDRSKLVAGYVGQTAILTKQVIDSAIGGVLFIDEAYTLSNSKNSGIDYGQEAIDTLLKAMEDNRDNLVVIVAGYPDLMKNFIKSNPGLESRFNTFIHFEDYSASELLDLLKYICKKNGMHLSDDACIYAKAFFEKLYENLPSNFSNGRYVRNIFEKLCRNQDNRIAEIPNPSRNELTEISLDDFNGIELDL